MKKKARFFPKKKLSASRAFSAAERKRTAVLLSAARRRSFDFATGNGVVDQLLVYIIIVILVLTNRRAGLLRALRGTRGFRNPKKTLAVSLSLSLSVCGMCVFVSRIGLLVGAVLGPHAGPARARPARRVFCSLFWFVLDSHLGHFPSDLDDRSFQRRAQSVALQHTLDRPKPETVSSILSKFNRVAQNVFAFKRRIFTRRLVDVPRDVGRFPIMSWVRKREERERLSVRESARDLARD